MKEEKDTSRTERYVLMFAAAATLVVLAAGCDSEDNGSCSSGEQLVDGRCVPAADAVTDGADDGDTNDAEPDANEDSSDAEDAEDSDAGSGEPIDFGGECNDDSQCRTDLGAYCYDGPYLQGFRFCTRNGGLAGELNAEQYPTLVYNAECWSFPAGEWVTPMTRSCETLADCEKLSSRYTRCGTVGLSWASSFGTQCPDLEDDDDTSILTSKKVCIIESLPPFNRRAEAVASPRPSPSSARTQNTGAREQ